MSGIAKGRLADATALDDSCEHAHGEHEHTSNIEQNQQRMIVPRKGRESKNKFFKWLAIVNIVFVQHFETRGRILVMKQTETCWIMFHRPTLVDRSIRLLLQVLRKGNQRLD
jgi:hypothetical protein